VLRIPRPRPSHAHAHGRPGRRLGHARADRRAGRAPLGERTESFAEGPRTSSASPTTLSTSCSDRPGVAIAASIVAITRRAGCLASALQSRWTRLSLTGSPSRRSSAARHRYPKRRWRIVNRRICSRSGASRNRRRRSSRSLERGAWTSVQDARPLTPRLMAWRARSVRAGALRHFLALISLSASISSTRTANAFLSHALSASVEDARANPA
jgi:hypothetical protein